jgi:hypothetical protein
MVETEIRLSSNLRLHESIYTTRSEIKSIAYIGMSPLERLTAYLLVRIS